MRVWLLVGALSLVSTPLVAAEASAGELAAGDPLLQSLVDEARAVERAVATIKSEVRDGNLDISTPAKLSWQRGVAAWEEVRAFAMAGLWDRAYRDAHIARLLCEKGAYEVFSVRASRPVRQIVDDYLDAIEPRLALLRERIVRLPDHRGLLAQWSTIKDHFERAKQLAATERYGASWTTVVGAAGQLDKLARTVVERLPDGEGAVTP